MTKVHIIKKFNTTLGTIFLTNSKAHLKVGDRIVCSDGKKYIIKSIQMPTKPNDEIFGILVSPIY